MSKSSHSSSHRVTVARRRVTLAILAISLVTAVVFGLAAPGDPEVDDVTIAAAGEPIAVALDLTSTTESARRERSNTTSETVVEATTTTTAAPTSTTVNATTVDEADEAERSDTQATVPEQAPEPQSPSTTSPPTTTAPAPSSSSSQDPESVIREIFGAHGDDAVAIARCESDLNPRAHNPAGYHGLFQIGDGHSDAFESVTGTDWESGRYQSRPNTVYAKHLFDQSGWSPWGCRHHV